MLSERDGRAPGAARGTPDEEAAEEAGKDPLESYAVISTSARAGPHDPLVGRQAELDRALHVLARRRKNNPLFVGDAGVGKTAIVEWAVCAFEAPVEVPRLCVAWRSSPSTWDRLVAGTRYRAGL